MIKVKNIHEKASGDDGFRVLVEPAWPKKVSRERAKLDVWLRDLAPSPPLAARFAGNLLDWDDFVILYHCELDRNRAFFRDLQEHNHNGGLTLLYSSPDREKNAAIALRMLLEINDRATGGGAQPAAGSGSLAR